MQLQCTLVRAPGAGSRGPGPAAGPESTGPGSAAGPVELTVSVPDGCPGAELDAELSRSFQTRELTVAGLPLSG